MAAAARARVTHLLRHLQSTACQCPTHSHTYSQAPGPSGKTADYAFEDLQNMGAKNVCLMTDKNLSQLPPVQIVMDSLSKNGISFQVYDDVRVEPTDGSFMDAIEFAKKGAFDACPSNPIQRPAYQGSNPISDIWAVHALQIVAKYLKRAVRNPDDLEARSKMHLASAFAGIGFGNAGVHLCHGMSYPISGLVKTYKAKEYNVDHPLVPHGLSVVLTSPAVFTFTAQMFPERHLETAGILGANIRTARIQDAGLVLADALRKFLFDLNVDDGLAALGYSKDDIPSLVKGTLPQERVTKLAPRAQSEEDLSALFEASMKLY